MRVAFLFLGILLCGSSYGQNRSKQVDSLVNSLRKKGIDTILIYMQGAVWHLQEKPDIAARSKKCHCSFGNLIYAVNIIYKDNGKTYKLDCRCCKETHATRIHKTLSIPYFLSQKSILVDSENAYYKNLRKNKKFPPPIPTDQPFEEVELIVNNRRLTSGLNSYESGEGYNVWKQYPWTDKEIELMKLIKQDLNLPKE